MHFKVSVKDDKKLAFTKFLQVLKDLDIVEDFEQLQFVFDQQIHAKSAETQQWAQEFTDDLAATELVKRYRDLVD